MVKFVITKQEGKLNFVVNTFKELIIVFVAEEPFKLKIKASISFSTQEPEAFITAIEEERSTTIVRAVVKEVTSKRSKGILSSSIEVVLDHIHTAEEQVKK